MVESVRIGKLPRQQIEAYARSDDLGREARETFRDDIDRDTDAFNELYVAMKRKRKTPEDAAARDAAILAATKRATERSTF